MKELPDPKQLADAEKDELIKIIQALWDELQKLREKEADTVKARNLKGTAIASALALVPLFNLLISQQSTNAQKTPPLSGAVAQQPQTEQDLSQADLAAIQAAVAAAVGRPGLPQPTIRRIAVEGAWGLASWQMGEAGGTVALWKEEFWKVCEWPGPALRPPYLWPTVWLRLRQPLAARQIAHSRPVRCP